ncbi:MAG: orotidine-5'-phosphate decarboxylase [Bradymonadaceae bacterium]|nr:orotidine-5'-phosphate decarboxylase [Lujinxingiaceae bacterium]
MSVEKLNRHLIVALDFDTLEQAEQLVGLLKGRIDKFKIGSRLFTQYGPTILDRLGALDAQIFLDLKFHDIPSVVGDACKNAASHEAVFLMTVHASGGRAMLEAAVRGARQGGAAQVIAVTALTSLSQADLAPVGVALPLEDWAERLATLAIDAGLDGLVCSPLEAAALRHRFGTDPILVTPGIRPGAPAVDDDQVRIMTPANALRAGSSMLVIGRPIYQAEDPVGVVEAIAQTL